MVLNPTLRRATRLTQPQAARNCTSKPHFTDPTDKDTSNAQGCCYHVLPYAELCVLVSTQGAKVLPALQFPSGWGKSSRKLSTAVSVRMNTSCMCPVCCLGLLQSAFVYFVCCASQVLPNKLDLNKTDWKEYHHYSQEFFASTFPCRWSRVVSVIPPSLNQREILAACTSMRPPWVRFVVNSSIFNMKSLSRWRQWESWYLQY